MTCPICARPVIRDMMLLPDDSLAHGECVAKSRMALMTEVRKRVVTDEWQFIEYPRLAAKRLQKAEALQSHGARTILSTGKGVAGAPPA
jgi:hypothetical protein